MSADPSGYAKSIVPVNELSYEDVKKELNDIYVDFVKKKKSNVPGISNKLLKTELDYGEYGSLLQITGDNITGHHMPSNDFMKKRQGSQEERVGL